jgi:hypothetical protein
MRKLFLFVILSMLIFPGISFAVHAEWNPPTTNVDGSPLTDLGGFNVYEVTGSRTKVNSTLILPSVCTGSPSVCSWTFPGGVVTEGDKFVVTAVDTGGNESGDSNQATAVFAPSAPGGLILKLP